jgi:hypothetical protein
MPALVGIGGGVFELPPPWHLGGINDEERVMVKAHELLAPAAKGEARPVLYVSTEYVGRNGSAWVRVWIVTDGTDPLVRLTPHTIARAIGDDSEKAEEKVRRMTGWRSSAKRVGYHTGGYGYCRRTHVVGKIAHVLGCRSDQFIVHEL